MLSVSNILNLVSCMLFVCKHEYPSDPLASQRVFTRSSRKFTLQGDRLSEYDFSNGISNPIVSTKSGKLEGFVMKSIKGRSIYAFEGVPFAETTGGDNRFKLAIPKAPWAGIRHAKKPGEVCLQVSPVRFMMTLGSEDCLFLNIYVPSAPINKGLEQLPVIVWFHGGSWIFGSGGEYGPAYLLEHNVILITVNYRLGIFGYLSTGDENMPGNLGNKDQRSALKYIHENIEKFGGDPKRVTIAGQSCGGASVHYHMLSNSSQGYFSGAISMSGTAFSPWTLMTRRTAELRNRLLAKSTNCPLNNSAEFVSCLKNMEGRTLVRKILDIYDLPLLAIPVAPLGTVIEENGPDAFLTEHPDDAYANGRVAKIPYISSRTTDEYPFALPDRLKGIQDLFHLISTGSALLTWRVWHNFMSNFLEYKHSGQNEFSVTEKLIEFYMRADGQVSLANFTGVGRLATDRMFAYPLHKTLQAHSQFAPTYSYLYGYQGRATIPAFYLGFHTKEFGVAHMDDLVSVFNISEAYGGYKTTDPEYAVVKLMTSTWYNFAAKRDPMFIDDMGNDQKIWDQITDVQNIRVLLINEEVKMIPEQYRRNLKFWDTLGLSDMKPIIRLE